MVNQRKIIYLIFNLFIAFSLQLSNYDVEERPGFQKDINCNKTCSLCDRELIYCSRFDHCGCCQICLRQFGEFCDVNNLCDHKKYLICQMDESTDHGVCRYNTKLKYAYAENNEKICIFNGMIYQSSVRFSISCRYRCQCINGLVTCQDLCKAVEESAPPPIAICPFGAELILPNDNQCCREWSCKNDVTSMITDQIMSNLKKRTISNHFCINKRQGETPWSPCSKTCGMGMSTRTSTNNIFCVNITEKRFCMYRECKENPVSLSSQMNLDNCKSTLRSLNASKIRIVLENENIDKYSKIVCYSQRKFRPRYCGLCSSCCLPITSKTKRIEFHCSDNKKRIKMYQWIKTCHCFKKFCKNVSPS